MRNQRTNGTGTEQNVQEEYRKQQRRGDNRITEHLQVAHKAIEEAMQETKTRADSAQHEIRSFESIRKEQLNEVSNQWELIRIIVDSGASDTVIPKHLCTSIPTRESEKKSYAAASGKTIYNEGEKELHVMTETGQTRRLVMQVCDVNQCLLSVSQSNKAGNVVVLDGENSYMKNKYTGEEVKLYQDNGVFVMYACVRPFAGPA